MSKYRFKVGEKVLFYCELSWVGCTIISIDYYDHAINQIAVYQLKRQFNGLTVLAFEDTGRVVREYVSEPIEMLKLFIKYHDSIDILKKFVNDNKINIKLKDRELLICTAENGNLEALGYIVGDCGVVAKVEIDSSGRNILHVALMKGQLNYALNLTKAMRSFIGFETSTFFRATDKKKRDALHYAVIANNHAFFNALLLRMDDYYGSALSYYGLIKELIIYRNKGDPWEAQTAFDNVTVDGHTAYDLAVAMKRPELAELVLKCRNACMAESFIQFLHHNLAHNIHNSREKYSYENILYTVDEASALLMQHTVDLTLIDTTPFSICLQHCAFHLASRGELTYLKWLIDAWRLDPVLTAIDAPRMNYDITPFLKHHNTRLSLPVAVTMGPIYSYVTMLIHKMKPTEQALLMNKTLNELFQHRYWKPEMSVKEHIVSCIYICRNSHRYESKYKGLLVASRSIDNYEIRYLDLYIDSVVARIDGICVEDRLITLSYLRDELKLSLSPLLLTVTLGQPHVLAWVAARRDLSKSLASNKTLMRDVKKVDWLSGVDTAISIASLLCYYAAGLGEIAVMQWLLKRFEAARVSRVGGMNLLHVAIAHDRVPCAIWLVRHLPSLVAELTDSGHSVLHLAIQHKHVWLTRFCMGLEYSDTDFESLWEDDSSGHGVYWHLGQSEELEFASWVKLKAQVTALESVITVLDERPMSSSSLEMLLKDIDFFGITRSLNIGPLSYDYDLWRADYSLNSLDYSCGLAAVLALIQKALLKGRWDLLFMIFDDLYQHQSEYSEFVVSVQTNIKSVAASWGIEKAGLDFVAYVFSRYSDGPTTLESDLTLLCQQLSVAFIELRFKDVVSNIEQQFRLLALAKVEYVDIVGEFHSWLCTHFFLFLKSAFPALENICKSELYPMTPLNYAITHDCEPLVRWILKHPRFIQSDRLSVLYSSFKAAVATSQYKYLDLLLSEDFGGDIPYYKMYRACADREKHHHPLKDNVIRQLLTRQACSQGDKIYKLYTHTLIPFVLGHLYYNITVKNESEIRKSMDLLSWLFAHPSVKHPEPKEAEQLVDCIIHQLSSKLSEFEPAPSMSADDVDGLVTYLVELWIEVFTLLQQIEFNFACLPWSTVLNHSLHSLFYYVTKAMERFNVPLYKPHPVFKLFEYLMSTYDVDVITFQFYSDKSGDCYDELDAHLAQLQQGQRDRLQLIDSLYERISVDDLEAMLKSDTGLLHSRDSKGRGLLHHAALLGRTDVMDLLLLSGYSIDLRAKDHDGMSSLVLARSAGQLSFATKLHRAQAELTVQRFCLRLLRLYGMCRRRRVRVRLQTKSAIALQKHWRRLSAHLMYGAALSEKLGTSKRLRTTWARGK